MDDIVSEFLDAVRERISGEQESTTNLGLRGPIDVRMHIVDAVREQWEKDPGDEAEFIHYLQNLAQGRTHLSVRRDPGLIPDQASNMIQQFAEWTELWRKNIG
jgi:hypothetical protein